MQEKIIYLLLGPKGSGKSFIGALMDQNFGIPFVRVEDWAKTIKKKRDILDGHYIRDVFETIEKGIRKTLLDKDTVVFESTGLSTPFDMMFENLKKDFNVVSIGIQANDDLCLERVRKRDGSIHIAVPDEQLRQINLQVRKKAIKTDFSLENSSTTEAELIKKLKKIIRKNSG